MEAKPYYIYIARCRDGSLYTGSARLRPLYPQPSGLRAGGAVVCRK